jgi:hypothetical protein
MPEVTYGELDEVLRSLGFSRQIAEQPVKSRWYEHHETGALIALPLLPESDPVQPRHLLAARSILAAYGIVDPLDFTAALQKAHSPEPAA